MKINKNEVYGVYVHIPFCLKKCSYCDFASYPGMLSRADCYLENVYAEMQQYRGITADSIYIGGGTPTALKKEQLTDLINKIRSTLSLTDDCEFTVECNPKTVDFDYLKMLKNNGVNRLSIGVQSLKDSELKMLGRVHSKDEAIECINMVKKAGFDNFNIDLMFGLPRQSLAGFKKTVMEVLNTEPKHISCYSLIVEDGTPISRRINSGELILPDEDTEREMYHTLVDILNDAGYKHYEISNFAKDGNESRHNNKYWERKPYIGLGAAAHSNIGDLRFGNPASLEEYEKVSCLKIPEGREKEHLTQEDEMSEVMILGLRKMDGISKVSFAKEFNKDLESVFKEQLSKFERLGLVQITDEKVMLTKRGIDVSNMVFCEFL